jgi:hypothetical protein
MSSERRNFKKQEIQDSWEKAETITGKNPDLYRKDKCNNVIYKPSYGKDSPLGWNVDHSKPLKEGGTYHPNNLQVLQTSQNKSKGGDLNYKYKEVEQKGMTPTMHTRKQNGTSK